MSQPKMVSYNETFLALASHNFDLSCAYAGSSVLSFGLVYSFFSVEDNLI